jgi:hypothetical protein
MFQGITHLPAERVFIEFLGALHIIGGDFEMTIAFGTAGWMINEGAIRGRRNCDEWEP